MAGEKIRRDKSIQQLIAETKKARSEALKNSMPTQLDESTDTTI